jgi:hypothetical protein
LRRGERWQWVRQGAEIEAGKLLARARLCHRRGGLLAVLVKIAQIFNDRAGLGDQCGARCVGG